MNNLDSNKLLEAMLAGIPVRGNYVHITIQKDLLNRLAKVNKMYGAAYDEMMGIK